MLSNRCLQFRPIADEWLARIARFDYRKVHSSVGLRLNFFFFLVVCLCVCVRISCDDDECRILFFKYCTEFSWMPSYICRKHNFSMNDFLMNVSPTILGPHQCNRLWVWECLFAVLFWKLLLSVRFYWWMRSLFSILIPF